MGRANHGQACRCAAVTGPCVYVSACDCFGTPVITSPSETDDSEEVRTFQADLNVLHRVPAQLSLQNYTLVDSNLQSSQDFQTHAESIKL